MARRSTKQTWSEDDGTRPRVLIECPPEASPTMIADAVARHGYAVRTCEGPEAGRCDLVHDGSCGLVDGADVVVNMLGFGHSGRQVLEAVADRRRPPALVVELTRPQAIAAAVDDGQMDLDRVTVVETPVTRQGLVDAIDAALGRRPDQTVAE